MDAIAFGVSFEEAEKLARPFCTKCGGSEGKSDADKPGMVLSATEMNEHLFVPCPICLPDLRSAGLMEFNEHFRAVEQR
jgi:hypothetical protein